MLIVARRRVDERCEHGHGFPVRITLDPPRALESDGWRSSSVRAISTFRLQAAADFRRR